MKYFLLLVMAVLAACSGPIISENEINNGPIQGVFAFDPEEQGVTASDAVIVVCNEKGYAFPSQPNCDDTDFDAVSTGLAFKTDRRGILETGTVSVIETGTVLLEVRRVETNEAMAGELFYTDSAGNDYKLTPLEDEPNTYRIIWCEGAGCPLGWRDGGDGGGTDAETYLVAITAETNVSVNIVAKTVDPEAEKSVFVFGSAGRVLTDDTSAEFDMTVGHILAIAMFNETGSVNLVENCRTSSEAVLWLTVEEKDPVALNKCTENFLTGELKTKGVFVTTGDSLVRVRGPQDPTPPPKDPTGPTNPSTTPTGDPVLGDNQMPIYFISGDTVSDIFAFNPIAVDPRWREWKPVANNVLFAYGIGEPFIFNCVLTSGRWGVELADRTQKRATCVTTVHAPWCTNRTSFELKWYDTNDDGISDLWVSNNQNGGNWIPQIQGTFISEGKVDDCRLTNSDGLVLAR